MKITVIGGDERLRIAEKELRQKGYTVDSIGLHKSENGLPESSDVLLLPVPTTRDGQTVYTPLVDMEIPLSRIPALADGKRILCGNYTFPELPRQTDYCKNDGYALKNAVPTAEGAIRIAIERTPFTLWHSKALVIGYGRVGKVLADRLKAMGCLVTVAARKSSDFGLAQALGFETANSTALTGLERFDLIFNTVDMPLLESAAESLTGKSVIDLSSKGGLLPQTAKQYNIDYCLAPGLPGKIAPVTAGKILAETVQEILQG